MARVIDVSTLWLHDSLTIKGLLANKNRGLGRLGLADFRDFALWLGGSRFALCRRRQRRRRSLGTVSRSGRDAREPFIRIRGCAWRWWTRGRRLRKRSNNGHAFAEFFTRLHVV